jgi:type II secretory pathway component GspD/PulD (secretin)
LDVAESVPVIGVVSYPSANGVPVQSIQYVDAGVIFKLRPAVSSVT